MEVNAFPVNDRDSRIYFVTHPHPLKSGQGSEGSQGPKGTQGLDWPQLWVTQEVGRQADDGNLGDARDTES